MRFHTGQTQSRPALAKKAMLLSAIAFFLALNITTPIVANGLAITPSTGINNTSLQASKFPYDLDNNEFIDQKLAKSDTAHPKYVNDGRFYDVGRNPDPMTGFAASPEGDWQFRVTHIKFDRSPDVGNSDETGEGLELHYTRTNILDHVRETRARGEWIYRWVEDDLSKGRNEPALYGCKDNNIKIMVRIECAKGDLDYAHIGALVMGKNPNNWPGIKTKKVDFQEYTLYPNYDPLKTKVWISKGKLDPANPAAGHSEYVELDFDGPVPQSINKSLVTWQWHVDKILPKGGGAQEFTAATVCKNDMKGWEINRSEGVTEITKPDGTIELKFSPHVFYTVLDKPTSPYYRPLGRGKRIAFPWVTALEFAIIDQVKLKGQDDADEARKRIATFCFAGYGVGYDHVGGASGFVYGLRTMGEAEVYQYNFSGYIANTPGPGWTGSVNCTDQACAVSTLIDLTCGTDAEVEWLTQFGYVPKLNFVGTIAPSSCNNPFYEKAIFQTIAVVGEDDTRWQYVDNGPIIKRSLFDFHNWVEVNGKVYDATAGPVGGGEVPTIVGSRAKYKSTTCDISKVGTKDWRKNELVPTKAPGYKPLVPNVPWIIEDSNGYTVDVKNADMDRVKSRALNLE